MHKVPPLIVGTTPILAAKIQLLGKSASCIEVITGERDLPADFQLPGVRLLEGQSVRTAHRQFRGRPLIVIDCGDEKLNASLAGRARALGVPVNVPDKPTLCSFYFCSIVDRAPVTIAISTAGLAPVLGQHLRAWMEDRLPAGYGRLALYLNRLRDRLHHLPAAHRRALLRRAAGGAGAALPLPATCASPPVMTGCWSLLAILSPIRRTICAGVASPMCALLRNRQNNGAGH